MTDDPTPTPSGLLSVSGKVAVVTGASRGIGAASARLLAAAGAHVWAVSRNADACADVVAEIRAAGGRADAHACHTGSPQAIEALFGVIEEHGGCDLLVNNAATNPWFGPLAQAPLAAIDKTIEVNLRGYLMCAQHAVRQMRERGSGAIVNVASVNAVQPGEDQGVYSMTKAAVVNMTRTLARECAADGIRVNALLPGLTRTRFSAALYEDEPRYRRYLERIPMRRMAEPEEMAQAVLFLCSPAASYVTGALLVADGGLLA